MDAAHLSPVSAQDSRNAVAGRELKCARAIFFQMKKYNADVVRWVPSTNFGEFRERRTQSVHRWSVLVDFFSDT